MSTTYLARLRLRTSPGRQTFPQIVDREQATVRDLVFIAGAYVILHELGHHRIAASSGDPEPLVRAKRILGILLAKLLIITVTPRDRWSISPDHEPVRRRLFRVLRYARDPLPEWFWDTAASLVAAFARRHGVLNGAVLFRSSRELAFALCRKFVYPTF